MQATQKVPQTEHSSGFHHEVSWELTSPGPNLALHMTMQCRQHKQMTGSSH